ncbi:MAG: hypothetical protein P4L31_04830 [Candidatus Babeliales bacterium]|nr:hypothetical protein [Candidatus Babeliales bacterium]
MESTSEKINVILLKILPLLEYGEGHYWFQFFKAVIFKLNNTNNQYEIIKSVYATFRGGMGSFTDLVLHKDCIPLIHENDELEDLKDQLYDACEEFLKKY